MTKYSSGHSKFKTPITAPLRTLAVLPPIPLAALTFTTHYNTWGFFSKLTTRTLLLFPIKFLQGQGPTTTLVIMTCLLLFIAMIWIAGYL